MWVWQSQAPAGTSKFTGVDGCAAFAKAVRWGMVTPAAMEARRIWRLVSIAFSPLWAFVFLILRFGTPAAAYQVRVEASDGPRLLPRLNVPRLARPVKPAVNPATVAGSSQTNISGKYAIAAGSGVRFQAPASNRARAFIDAENVLRPRGDRGGYHPRRRRQPCGRAAARARQGQPHRQCAL